MLLAAPALLAAALYVATMTPGVAGFDSAELITGAHTLGIVHPTGYPLYLMLGKLFTFLPINSIAFRVNLVSAVFGAVAVHLAARWIFAATSSLTAAWLGSLTLGLSYGTWSMATVAEVYTLQLALLLATLLSMRIWLEQGTDRWLYLMVFFFGLSMTNHVTAALLAPTMLMILVAKIGVRALLKRSGGLLLALLLGLLPYLYLPLRYAADPPLNYVKSYYNVDLTTVSGMLWMVSGRAYRFFAFGYDLAGYLREVLEAVILIAKNFTLLGAGLGSIGQVWLLRNRRMEGFALLVVFVLNMLFFAGYAVADKETMFLPAFGIWSLLIGVGAWRVGVWLGSLDVLTASERRIAYQGYSGALIVSMLLLGGANLRWLDRSGDIGPDLYARRILSTLPENAFVIGRWSSAVVLEYYQYVEGLRPDIHIFNRSRYEVALYYDLWSDGVEHDQALAQILAIEEGIVTAFAEERQVFDAEYNPYLAQYYEYQPVGQVFRLIPRGEG